MPDNQTPTSAEVLLERASQLAPNFRQRAPETDSQRRLPEESLRELHESGLLRALQPGRVGGSQLPFGFLVEAGERVGRACGSTAWLLGNFASHHWMLAMWPAVAQDEVWSDCADALIASSFVFTGGRAERVPGGWRLSGRWPFSSGVEHCSWNMLGALASPREGAAPSPHLFLLPRTDYRIHDTWNVLGLRGTGSHDVEVDQVFVPDRRVLAAADARGGASPGSQVNPGSLYRLPMLPMLPFAIGSALLGIGRGALDDFLGGARARRTSAGSVPMAELPAVQVRVGEAGAALDAAKLLLLRACADATLGAERGEPFDELEPRLRRDGAYAARLCVRAVDSLFEACGGAALFEQHPLERAFRDARAGAAHGALSWDVGLAGWGRASLAGASRGSGS